MQDNYAETFGSYVKIVGINYKMMHLMVLHEFFSGYSESFDILLIKGIWIFFFN